MIGKKVWLIPDAFWDSNSKGIYPSHESVCVLNVSENDAKISMTLYFEDREPMKEFDAECPSKRTHHIRMDKLVSKEGKTVPQDTPYAILVESDIPVVVQYSRLDTAQAEMGFLSTMAFGVE